MLAAEALGNEREDSIVDKQPQKSNRNPSETARQIKDSLKWLTADNIRKDGESAIKQSHALRLASRIRSLYGPGDHIQIIDAYVEGKLVDVFTTVWNLKNSVNLREEKNPVIQTFRNVYVSFWNLTDISHEICDQAVQKGVIKNILTDLRKPEFLEVRQATKDDSAAVYITSGYLSILNNLVNDSPVCANVIIEANGISAIRAFTDAKLQKPKTKSIFLLSVILTDDKKNELSTILDKSNASYILTVLEEAYKQANHFSKVYGYTVMEVLISIGNITNFSEHFVAILIELNFLDTLEELLLAPHLIDQQASDKKVKFSTIEEKVACCRCLWSITFYQKSCEALQSKQRLCATLDKIEKLPMSSETAELKKYAGGVLWSIRKATGRETPVRPDGDKKINRKRLPPQKIPGMSAPVASGPVGPPPPPALRGPDSDSEGHVMISYSWATQDAVKAIVGFLKHRGKRTWVDIENMQDSTIQAMASAIEDASVVLICYSQQYFQSPNCRAEAEYAYQLKKRIVPIRVQKYTASGWLGFIIGAQLWYDISDPKNFENTMAKVCNALDGNASVPSLNEPPAPAPLQTPKQQQQASQREMIPKLPLDTEHDNAGGLFSMRSAPPYMPNAMQHGNPYQVLQTWSVADVQKWLGESGLDKHKSKFASVDGIMLHEIVLMDMRTPAFLYEQLKNELKLDFCSLLTFVNALHRLIEKLAF